MASNVNFSSLSWLSTSWHVILVLSIHWLLHLSCFYGMEFYFIKPLLATYSYSVFLWHGHMFFHHSFFFCDSLFPILIIWMLKQFFVQDPILQKFELPTYTAMPYLSYWHNPLQRWVCHWLEAGAYKIRSDEAYLALRWWCRKLVRRMSSSKWRYFSKFNKTKKGFVQFDWKPIKLVKAVQSKFKWQLFNGIFCHRKIAFSRWLTWTNKSMQEKERII